MDRTLTPRETFVYLIVALIKDPTVAALGIDRRTVILDEMRKKFCPEVTDVDWSTIADDIDKRLQPQMSSALRGMMKGTDWHKLHVSILERFTKNTGGFR